MMAFVTPLYYYGMSAQLKAMVDRFCAFNASIHSKHMKAALLTTAWNSDDWTFEASHDEALPLPTKGVPVGATASLIPREKRLKNQR